MESQTFDGEQLRSSVLGAVICAVINNLLFTAIEASKLPLETQAEKYVNGKKVAGKFCQKTYTTRSYNDAESAT